MHIFAKMRSKEHLPPNTEILPFCTATWALGLSRKKGKIGSVEVNIWRIKGFSYNTFLLVIILFALSGCNTTADTRSEEYSNLQQLNSNLVEKLAAQITREDSLSARETAVSARETELVTLFSELLKEKKMLEIERSDLAYKKNSERVRTKPTNNKTAIAIQTIDKENTPTIIGGLEKVYLDPPGLVISARVDTGATTSSLNAIDMVELERDGKPYIKFHIIDPKTGEKIELTRRIRGHKRIKEHEAESQRRPIITMRIKLGDIDERIKFTLVDRSQFEQQVLIGRNLLRDLAIVDVSKKYTMPSTASSQ